MCCQMPRVARSAGERMIWLTPCVSARLACQTVEDAGKGGNGGIGGDLVIRATDRLTPWVTMPLCHPTNSAALDTGKPIVDSGETQASMVKPGPTPRLRLAAAGMR